MRAIEKKPVPKSSRVELDAEAAQPPQTLGHVLVLGHHGVLREVELEAGGGEPALAQRVLHAGHDVGLEELAGGEVHRELYLRRQRRREAGGGPEDAGADGQDEAALLGLGDEPPRGDEPELGVAPAQERLERGGALLVQYGQVHHLELVPLEGHAQAVEEAPSSPSPARSSRR